MTTGFEWDPAKRESNLRKHGIDFVDAVEVFQHFNVRLTDPRRYDGEERIVTIGLVRTRLVTVVCTVRGIKIRIISARRANRRETRAYRSLRPSETQEPDGLGPG